MNVSAPVTTMAASTPNDEQVAVVLALLVPMQEVLFRFAVAKGAYS